jgi:Ca2+-transporting ATPase
MTARGLSTEAARRLLEEHGANELPAEHGPGPLRILAGQFTGLMVWLLIAASALSAFLGEVADAVAIGVIVLVNAGIGFAQEYRAERAMDALRAMTAPRARVVRDGHTTMIPAAQVVVGDLLVLDAGDVVAADARLVEASALSTNEASLTGESMPVEKGTEPTRDAAPLAERTDHVFMGTAVATGSGRAEVAATGRATELGQIAGMLASTRAEETPLEAHLRRVGRTLALGCVVIVALVAISGLVRGDPWGEVVISGISLAVAAVPEGLAAIVTIALALGVQRMAARRALVRRLPAVEALGCATVICTDKTGTLTTGKMRVRELWGRDHDEVVRAAIACSDAELDATGLDGTGDPTEVALVVAGAERGIRREDIEERQPRVAVHPFDAVRKRMSIRRADGRVYVKGAPDLVLPRVVEGDVAGATEQNRAMAARGLRVLAVAVGARDDESELTLVGLVGLADPPRTEAIAAIAAARAAGIRTVMITGDQALTARAIARELGLLTGADDEREVVHARATPEDKLRIVREWKSRGEIVAMTGDGVNDAPALREAHIGIAMGKTGTDVAREAASIVLTDDDFATIIEAVREGRGIFENIQKTLVYLLAGNMAELALVVGAALLGLPLPLTALQILWINLVTDSLPALALVMDPADADVLRRPPRPPSQPILGASQWRTVAFVALVEASVVLATYAWALDARDGVEARNLAFSVLVFSEVLRSFAARSASRVFFATDVLSNLKLVAVVALTILVQLGIHHVPFTQELFEIGAISMADCALSLFLGAVPVTVIEIAKLLGARVPRAPARTSPA